MTSSQNPCSQKLGEIYEYLDGALSCDELQKMDDHLKNCEHCAKEHDLECVIRSVVKRSCCEAAPQDLKEKIWKKISTVKETAHSAPQNS